MTYESTLENCFYCPAMTMLTSIGLRHLYFCGLYGKSLVYDTQGKVFRCDACMKAYPDGLRWTLESKGKEAENENE